MRTSIWAGVGQAMGKAGRVVSGVEDEHSHRAIGGLHFRHAPYVLDGGGGGIGGGWYADGVKRGGPRVGVTLSWAIHWQFEPGMTG